MSPWKHKMNESLFAGAMSFCFQIIRHRIHPKFTKNVKFVWNPVADSLCGGKNVSSNGKLSWKEHKLLWVVGIKTSNYVEMKHMYRIRWFCKTFRTLFILFNFINTQYWAHSFWISIHITYIHSDYCSHFK